MLQYNAFKVSEIETINAFLAKNPEGISRDGTVFEDGMVCFLYLSDDREQRLVKSLVQGIRTGIHEFYNQLTGLDVDARYYQSLSIQGDLKAPQTVTEIAKKKKELLDQIHYSQQVIQELESGEWMKQFS